MLKLLSSCLRASRRLKPLSFAIALAAGGGLLAAPKAEAAVIINVSEIDGHVVAEASGTINLAGLNNAIVLSDAGGSLNPSRGYLTTGLFHFDALGYINITSGPKNFGTGTALTATHSSGNMVGIYHTSATNTTVLLLQSSYVSGASLLGSATWEDQTLASLGLEAGTYIWTWGSGENEDSLTINVILEPATWASLSLGIAGLLLLRRRSQAA